MLTIADFARTVPDKRFGYALNPEHPRGGHKVLVFERVLGYNRRTAGELDAAIREGIRTATAEATLNRRGELEFVVDLVLRGPSGREATVRAEWVYDDGETFPSPTTVFIRRRRPRGKNSAS